MGRDRLRIMVCPHELAMGGSQMNAIELAAQAQRDGHQVVVFAPEGPLSQHVAQLGLEQVISPVATRLSLRWMRELGQLATRWNADVVHTYEWAPSMAAAYRLFPLRDVRLVMTVLSMDIPDFLPRNVPMIVGTEQLRREATGRSAPVLLMEPPIDTDLNSLAALGSRGASFRSAPDELLLSMVCRMTDELDKAAGVIQAIAAVERLAAKYRLRLVVAGDGDAMERVRSAADSANHRLEREAVLLLGDMPDPREVYGQCDISLGMGSSALKALSFGKPLIVQGAAGFWKALDEQSLPQFQVQGFYGEGGDGVAALIAGLEPLCADETLRENLGSWGRNLAEERYSLHRAAQRLEANYRQCLRTAPSTAQGLLGLTRSSFDYAKFLAARRLSAWSAS